MIDAPYTILGLRPKTLNGICMSIAQDLNLLSMRNRIMFVAHRGERVVDIEFIREDLRALLDVISHNWENGVTANILDCAGFEFAFALNHPKHRRFLQRTAPAHSMRLAPEVGFIHFNLAAHLAVILKQHPAHLLAHAPRAFISDARLALNLLCRNAAPCLRHEVDHIEPGGERGRGFVEDRASGGRELPAAEIASVNLAGGNAIKLLFASAILALDDFGIPFLAKIIKTDRKSTRLNSSHQLSRMPSAA